MNYWFWINHRSIAAIICSVHHKSITVATIWNVHHKSIVTASFCNANHKSIAAATICSAHHKSIVAATIWNAHHLLLTLVCMHRSATFVYTCTWPWYVSTGLITTTLAFKHKHRHTSTWHQFNTVVSTDMYKLFHQVTSVFESCLAFPLTVKGDS